jgi:16S rRNA (cytosine967-C5)-methyltransferase
MPAAHRIAESQAQVFLRLLRALRGRWHTDAALPAALQSLLAANPSFGSRDRRLYRELVFTTLRFLPWIEPLLDGDPAEAARRAAWLAADTPDTRAFRAALAIGAPPAGDRAELLPAWFREHCPAIFSGAELDAQLARAPLWLRLQTDAPESVFAEFAARGWKCSPSEILPGALRVETAADVTKTDSYLAGHIEIQDLGSQLVLESLGLPPGGRWLDACAGAGGKTLQLARLLGPAATVEAHDIRPAALAELRARAARAGATNIRVTSRPSAGDYDGVLVDAPCSGSGTWRRAPHLKWTTTPELVARRAELQHHLLAKFAVCVRPGGLLIYATCSLSAAENEAVAERFLAGRPDFAPQPPAQTFGFTPHGHGLTILPARHDTDGFFVAAFRRRG